MVLNQYVQFFFEWSKTVWSGPEIIFHHLVLISVYFWAMYKSFVKSPKKTEQIQSYFVSVQNHFVPK